MNIFLENMTEVLENTDPTEIHATSILRDFKEWDSLTALSLIAMVDQEYSVRLTGDDIQSAVTLEDIYNIIQKK